MVLLHSILRWLVLLAGVGALIGYARARGPAGFDSVAERLGAVYAGTIGVQLVVGVIVWLVQGRWSGDEVFQSFIHPLLMVAATGVASVAVARARRSRRAGVGLLGVAASIVLVLLAIPSGAWPL